MMMIDIGSIIITKNYQRIALDITFQKPYNEQRKKGRENMRMRMLYCLAWPLTTI